MTGSDPDPEDMSRADLEAAVGELRSDVEDFDARFGALNTRIDAVLDVVLGDREMGEQSVENSAALIDRVDDLQAAAQAHGQKIDQLNDAPGKSAGVAKVAKVREAIVRRADRKGKTTVAQAAQQKPVAIDYDEVLALFDYEIDRSYASKLLSKAACDESDGHEAFWIDNTTDRKRLKLDLSELPEESPYRPETSTVNADSRGDGARESFTTSHSGEGG